MTKSQSNQKRYESIICFFIGHFWGIYSIHGRGMDRPTFQSKTCVRCNITRSNY